MPAALKIRSSKSGKLPAKAVPASKKGTTPIVAVTLMRASIEASSRLRPPIGRLVFGAARDGASERAAPADWQVERSERSERPIGVAPHRAATASKEADIGRDVLETRPRDRAETEASGEDVSGLVIQRVVGRALRLGDEDRGIRAKEAGVGCGGSREA